jgi:hypothetical protein
LAWRGLSALTDAAIEDLATRVVSDEHARRFLATKREYGREGRVIYLDQYRTKGTN